jgi:hydroxyacylglutathione hydrolase
MIFRQITHDDLGCASYLVGCEACGEAVVVDPAYAIEQYLEEADRREVRIVRTLETHTHADHVSGHGRLALEHGAPVSIHSLAQPAYPFDPLADGREIEVGNVTLRVIHTPGHRPEHCCFAVTDRTRADEPWLLLTGDSLFVGDAARPDLAIEAREGAEGLFHSLRRLLELGDGVEVYPGHVAGSLCGKGMSSKASTTIGFERRFNPALALATVEAFVAESAAVGAPRPPNMERIVELNRGPLVGAPADVPRLDDSADAPVLDVRRFESFAAGHVPGAFSVPVTGSSFATKAAFVLPAGAPPVVHASSPEEGGRAVLGLRSVGLLELRGVLVDPVPSATERLAPVALAELESLLADDRVELVDVREESERAETPLAGSRHVPYRLAAEAAATLPRDRTVVTVCESGPRAAVAASVLAARGVPARPLVDGGVRDLLGRAAVDETSHTRREDVTPV